MRNLLNYGFVSYTGQVWANSQVDSYNAMQTNINGFLSAGFPAPEYMLNGSHNLMVSFSRGYK